MGDCLFDRRTRSDEISPRTFSRSTRVTQPASLQTYQRADRTDHTFLNPLPTYQTPLPTYQSSSASVLASESERKSWREISLQEPPSAVSLQVVVIRPSVLSSFASLYLLFLPLSPKVTKNQTPWQAHVDGERELTGFLFMYSGNLVTVELKLSL